MFIAENGQLTGMIAAADTLKDNAIEALDLLKKTGKELIILTGDNQRVADAIAQELGIDRVYAQVLPDEKQDKIEELQAEGKNVAMVGDGINDAPALATANVGIAIGTGTEIAIEAADITILGGDLLLIPEAIQMSEATIQNIKQNLFWAFGYNTLGIPIAAVGLLAPWVAGAAMAFSSVSVVLYAADITSLGGYIILIPEAIQISEATIQNIKQNLFWEFGYNTLGIPIAAVGLLAPWVAGAAMAFSSVSVVLNALRLKRVKIN